MNTINSIVQTWLYSNYKIEYTLRMIFVKYDGTNLKAKLVIEVGPYGVKKYHWLRSEFHSILTPVEWKFTTQRVESHSVHSILTPKVSVIGVK